MAQENCWVCGIDVLADDNFCRKCGVQLQRSRKQAKGASNHRNSVGLFLIVVGGIVGTMSYLMNVVPTLALGVGSLLIGVMVLYLPDSGTVKETLAANSIIPLFMNIEKLLEDLDLDERGIYIPVSGLGVAPKVFVPMARTSATEHPPLGLTASNRIFVTVGKNPEDRGILLEAPGAQILIAMEEALKVDLAHTSSENLRSLLDTGFRSVGVAKVIGLDYDDSASTISMEIESHIELEERLRDIAPRLVVQIGTPIASAAASAVAKATGKYVTLRSTVLNTATKRINVSLKMKT